ncbi:MAG: restriction endonuclease subunit S [Candidatus Kapaibacterium sp.]
MEKLRFKNSHGEYSEIKSAYLGEVAQIKTGDLNVQDSSVNGAYPFFDRSVDIKRLDVYSYDKEAIIYPGEGSEFYPRLYRGKFALHQRAYAIFDFNADVNLDYIYQYLKTKNKHFLTTAVGSTVKSLRMDCFEKCEIKLPEYNEQEKIGGFLSSFDELIQKQQEKIGLLKELKKGYLQQMFPVKGSNIPKIRFKGFTEAWEQRKVSEITSFHKQGYYTTESYSDTKKYYLLRGTDFSQNSLILKDTPKIDASEKDYQAFKVEIGDFLIVRSGTVGTYGIVYDDIPAIFGSYLINFRFDQSIVMNEFFGLFYQSHLFRSQLSKIIQQSANTNINAENIKSTSIQLPLLQEQRKISIFLESIDKLITLHQHKLEKLEEMKKGYMQRLFI